MLFKEILSGNYKMFARMKEEKRSKNIASVKYILNLASLAGVDVSSWDAQEVFGTGSSNDLIDNKNEINRRFFERSEEEAKKAPPPAIDNLDSLLSDGFKNQIKLVEAKYVADLVAQEQAKYDEQFMAAQRHWRQHETYMRAAAEIQQKMRSFTGQKSNLEEQVRTIAASTFWKFHGFTDGCKLEFTTRSDVVLSHVNPAAGVNITINFGKFKAVYNLETFELRVLPFENNVFSQGYPHPHIGSSGGVCWGSADIVANTAITKCQIVEPMTLLATILQSYNQDSPYQSMEVFQDVVGSPEDQMLKDDLEEKVAKARTQFAAADVAPLDLDMWARPAATTMTTVTESVPDLVVSTSGADVIIVPASPLTPAQTANT